jgi:subtilase family serine protease
MTVKRAWRELMLDVISRKRWMSVGAMVLVMSASLVSQTVSQTVPQAVPQTTPRPNRITQDVASGGIVAVAGTVHPLTRRATDLGAVNSAMQLDSLTLNVGLSAAQQTELNALSEAQQDRKSAQYHQWLTQEEYGARFGLTDADLNKVTGWLTGQGFTVKGVSKSRNAIYFGGKAWQVESAFHTQLHQFQVDGETHFANATELRVPAAIGSVMLNVRGLNNFRLKPHGHTQIAPDFNNGPNQHYLTPGDWATIYNVTSIYGAGYTGTGAHVGVVGQTYAPQADIDHFRTASSLGTTNISYVCIDKSVSCTASTAIAPSSAGDLGEADLDIEWAGGVAKNATVDFVYAPFNSKLGVFDALQYAVQTYKVPATGKVLPVISMSYTDCEANLYTNGVLNSEATFVTTVGQQAQLQGQTIVVASGDAGAAGCDAQGVSGTDTATGGAWAGVPVDSPFYTGVGGTTLSGDQSNPASYWNLASTQPSTALSYIPEIVWNNTSIIDGLSTSGGGVSTVYAQPTWQSGLISGQTSWRMIPDVAFAASVDHNGYMICSQQDNSTQYGTMCASGTFYSSITGNFFVAGGTSAAAPSFAGMLTLLTQKYGNLGNINPTLYGFANTNPSVFHDITSGSNDVPCFVETSDPGCVFGMMGWPATIGYDLTTGLGSIDGGQLYNALGPSSVAGTATIVSVLPNPLTTGGTANLSATVTSTTAGTITGTITFKAGDTILSVVPLSAGTALLDNVGVASVNGFTVGSNSIAANYSGDAKYEASGGVEILSVNGLTTTTTVSTSPNSVTTGGTLTLTATVSTSTPSTPSQTFTAPVTFTVGTSTIGAAYVSSSTTSVSGTVGTFTANVASVTTSANGFSIGSDTITASYPGDASYTGSSGATTLTVVAAPTYALAAGPSTITISAGSSTPVTLTLSPTNYAGMVTLTATSSSPNNVSVTLSSSSIALAGGAQSPTLTITTSASATNHAPATPWSGGAIVFCAVLLGTRLRRKRAIAVLLTGLAISAAGFLLACGGGGGSSSTKTPTPTPAARTYLVTVTATGSGAVANPLPVTIVVTVP